MTLPLLGTGWASTTPSIHDPDPFEQRWIRGLAGAFPGLVRPARLSGRGQPRPPELSREGSRFQAARRELRRELRPEGMGGAGRRLGSSSESPVGAAPQAHRPRRSIPRPTQPEAGSHFAKCDRMRAASPALPPYPPHPPRRPFTSSFVLLHAPLRPSGTVAVGAALGPWATIRIDPQLGAVHVPEHRPTGHGIPRPTQPEAGSHFAKCDRMDAAADPFPLPTSVSRAFKPRVVPCSTQCDAPCATWPARFR